MPIPRQRLRSLLTTFVAIAAVLLSLPVMAQEIVELNQEGITAFSEGRFEEAAQKFQQAYEIKPEPPLKKNEAVAWLKAEKCPEALAAANEYLALGVDNELSTREAQTVVVRCHIKRAEEQLAAGDTDAAALALTDARAATPTEEDAVTIARIEGEVQAQRDADAAARQASIAAAEAEKQRAAEAQRRRQVQTVGLAVGAAGAAIVLGTLVYHIALATGTAPNFKDAAASGDRAEYERLGKKLETGNWLVPTLYAVGLATTGLGGYIWWRGGSKEVTPAASGAAQLEVGFSATWTF